MDMFHKLKNTVTGALPGNPVTREFDLGKHVGSAGPGLLWKIYEAVKKTTKQEASVFMFDKKQIEKYSKRDKDLIIEHLKHGVGQLTRLRHPKILSVFHPLEESRETLAFATEPVFASLANVLGYHSNMPDPLPHGFKEHQLYEVEMKYGLLQLTEGLAFLHNDAKILHRNICLESVIINKNGAWKLSGFESSVKSCNPQDQEVTFPMKEWDDSIPPLVQPHLDYLAPEYVLTMKCHVTSDMYSLGVLIYALYNNGSALFECKNQLSTFKSNAAELRRLKTSILGKIPDEVRDNVKLLLNVEPSVRPDAYQMSKLPYFEDVGVMTLYHLDTLFHQQDNLAKSKFFKGLPQVVTKMPKRINIERMLPALFQECSNHDMVPFILPNILLVAEQVDDHEYVKFILPKLKPLMNIKEPVQVMLICMQNMSLLLSKTPSDDIKNHVLPMIFRAIESDVLQIQELCLNIIPTFANLIDYTSMKNAVIPRIKKLCLSAQSLSIKVNCLLCIGKLLEFMDKWAVLDDILPMLPEINSKEPAVLMSVLGIYKVAFTHEKLGITKDVLATKVLPFLIPLSIDNNLNLPQYNAFTSVIRDMVTKVETEHRSKLEQLSTMEQEQKTLQFSQEPVKNASNLVAVPNYEPKQNSMMDKFLSGFGGVFNKSDSVDSTSSTSSSSGQKTLNLSEKQRVAQQQELLQQMKNQKPLAANKTSIMKTQSQQPKDLTSSLRTSAVNNSTFTSASSNSMQKQPQKASPLDLSAFDNLISPSNSGSSRQVASTQRVGQGGDSGLTSGMMSGQRGMMGNQTGMMGNQSGMMGSQSGMMGNRTGMMGSQSGMMGSQIGMMGSQGGMQSGMIGSQGGMMSSQSGMMGSQSGMMGTQSGMMGNQSGMMGNQSGMMGTQSGMMGTQSGMMGNQSGMMGTQIGMMGNQSGMMGTQSGMMGNQSGMMGNQSGMMGSQSSMMGNPSGMIGSQSGMMGTQSGMTGSQSGMTGSHSGMMGSNQMYGQSNNMSTAPWLTNQQSSTMNKKTGSQIDDLLG